MRAIILASVVAIVGLTSWVGLAGYRRFEAMSTVKEYLRDPAGAQFDDVVHSGAATCGYVNPRNPAGGYDGFIAFVTNGESAQFWGAREIPVVEQCAAIRSWNEAGCPQATRTDRVDLTELCAGYP